MLVELFGWALRPHTSRRDGTAETPQRPFQFGWARLFEARRVKTGKFFPVAAAFHSEVRDTVLSGAIIPLFYFFAQCFSWIRLMQQGHMQVYLLYIFVILIVLLLWR